MVRSESPTPNEKGTNRVVGAFLEDLTRSLEKLGRGGGIRTHDPLLPKQMRYQAALRPEEARILQMDPIAVNQSAHICEMFLRHGRTREKFKPKPYTRREQKFPGTLQLNAGSIHCLQQLSISDIKSPLCKSTG